MTELSQLLTQSGMSVSDFSYAIGVRKTSIERMLTGAYNTPDGVIADVHQLLADIDFVQSAIECTPELKYISYKVWKKCLTDSADSI